MDSAEILNQHVKVIFLLIITLYSIWGYYWTTKFAGFTPEDIGLNYLLVIVVTRAATLAWLIFFPALFLAFGAVSFTLAEMFSYVISFYSVVLIILFIYVLLFGLGSILDLLGFSYFRNILSQSNFQKAFKWRWRK